MTQVEKDKAVWVRQGSTVLRDGATKTEVLAAPMTGKVSGPPLTRFLGMVEITPTSGKKVKVAERRVICPGKVVGQGSTVTVLPTALLLAI